MHSVYMFYGGTNWGGINFPGAYTSYDYAASIRETRFMWEKYDESRMNLALRYIKQFVDFIYCRGWYADICEAPYSPTSFSTRVNVRRLLVRRSAPAM